MITKQKAVYTIAKAYKGPDRATDLALIDLAIDALDRAGAFVPDDGFGAAAMLAEIEIAAREILGCNVVPMGRSCAGCSKAALRLARACKAAGLVK